MAVAARMLISGPISGPNDSSLGLAYSILLGMGAMTLSAWVRLATSICCAMSPSASVVVCLTTQSHGLFVSSTCLAPLGRLFSVVSDSAVFRSAWKRFPYRPSNTDAELYE